MKKLLTAIATTAAVALAGIIAAPAARALPTFGEVLGDGVGTYQDDLNMLFTGQAKLSEDETSVLQKTALSLHNTQNDTEVDINNVSEYASTLNSLLLNPSQLDDLYSGSDAEKDVNNKGFGVFTTARGCSVNADCALRAIGWMLSVQCAGEVGMSGNIYSPIAWAQCVHDKDENAYYEALNDCTWRTSKDGGSCDLLNATSGQKVFACNKSPNAVVAGKVLLNLPPTLSQGTNDSMQIGLLSQG
ncbi:MAG: hypothetical protein F6K35_42050 [Okeania sp. SIO2H7]|nr:hypothetical protein [Okeania sp. SIO2H7]